MTKTNKTVLITGASSGIGAATAQYFLNKGWQVAASMRNPKKAPSWSQHADCLIVQLDVTDELSVKTAVAATLERFGVIDVVVNNAGYGLNGPIEGVQAELLNKQFQTNVLGLVEVTRAVLPHMRERRNGTIVNISSVGGRVAFPFVSAYNATKFAVEGLSESMRFELALHGILVKLVEPGGIKTDFYNRSAEWSTHEAYEPQVSNYRATLERSAARMAGAESVAQVIYKAATDSSAKLRYRAKAGPILAIRAILSDALWRRMIGFMLSSRPSKSLSE